MKRIYAVDRIEKIDEQSFAVMIPDDGGSELVIPLSLSEQLSGERVSEGDVFEVELDSDIPSAMRPLSDEKKKRGKRNASRLQSLFGRKNKKIK
ncbi:MAG: DUF3006 family protein [Clostridia bacterium]|nr:DUF3006 family protein [Clostridia bacterium]